MSKAEKKTQSEAQGEALSQFADVLRYLLKARGESQRQAGDGMKKKFGTKVDYQSKLSKYVKLRNAPTLDSMVDVAAYMEVPLWMFFVTSIPKDMLRSADGRQLAQIVADYVFIDDPEGRKAIANMAKGYADLKRKKGSSK